MLFYQRIAYPNYSDLQAHDLADMARDFRDSLANHVPVVFFFPGVQTTDNSVINGKPVLNSLNYKSHFLERHLGGRGIYSPSTDCPGGMKLFTLTYSNDSRLWMAGSWIKHRYGRTGDARSFLSRPNDYFSKDANEWTENLLIPALKDEEGKWLPVHKIQARLRHLTLFGDSYGSIFAEQIANCLQEKMKNAGISDTDIARVLKSIVLVAASNIPQRTSDANGYQVGHYSGIYLEGNQDHFIQGSRHMNSTHLQRMSRSMMRRTSHAVEEEPYVEQWLKDFSLNDSTAYTILPHDEGRDGQDDRTKLPPEDKSSLAFTRVIKNKESGVRVEGIKVNFDVPENYTLRVRMGPQTKLLNWHNTERHQSGSYYGMGDQQHVVARTLRNAVRLGMTGGVRSPRALIETRAMPIVCHPDWAAWEGAIQDRMDRLITARMKDMSVDDGRPGMMSRRKIVTLGVSGSEPPSRSGRSAG